MGLTMRALIFGLLFGALLFAADYYWPDSHTIDVEIVPCDAQCHQELNDFVFGEEPEKRVPAQQWLKGQLQKIYGNDATTN